MNDHKTIVIFTNEELETVFFVIDGDFQHLDRTIIGAGDDNEFETELNGLLCTDDGFFRHEKLTDFPLLQLLDQHSAFQYHVIVCGIVM